MPYWGNHVLCTCASFKQINFVPELSKTSPRRRRTNHPKTTAMSTVTKTTAAKIQRTLMTTMTAKTQKTPMTMATTANTQMTTRKTTQIAPKARTTATFKTIPVGPKATILQMKTQTVPKEMEALVGRIPTTIATMLMTLRREGTETTLNKESNSKAKAIQAQHIPIYCTSLP